MLDTARKSYAELLKQVQNGEPIRIWASREPDAMCGLYWLMEQLRPVGLEKLDVTVVELPEWEKDQTVVSSNIPAGERLSLIVLGKWHY